MEQTSVQKLARVLRVLVLVVFVCNLAALLLVPGVVGIRSEGGWLAVWGLTEGTGLPVPLAFLTACWQYIFRVWREPYGAVLSAFLLLSGACTAFILWQAKRVLDTILRGEVFTGGNADNLKRAAVCCFVISGAALIRLVWSFWYVGTPTPLFTYNALFVPIFLLAGLVCMVMSALFRQAAELKAENDLTI